MNAKELQNKVESSLQAGKYVRGTYKTITGNAHRCDLIRVFPTARSLTIGYWYTNWKGEFYARERVPFSAVQID